MRGGELIERPKEYRIDAEIGRIEVDTFEIKEGSKKVFSTKRDVFPETGPREQHKSVCLREVAVFTPCDETFRKSAEHLNRQLWREEKQDQISSRTLANLVEREGEAIIGCIETKAQAILHSHDFTSAGQPKGETNAYRQMTEASVLSPESVEKAAKEVNEMLAQDRQIDAEGWRSMCENPAAVKAFICVDDVLCKKQKESGRKKGSISPKKKERVKNTVAHIQSGKGETYTLTTPTISRMMTVLLAFLFLNGLMTQPGQLVFFTDGAQDLLGAIQNGFSFLPFKIILDWYHLAKKCQQRLSMAMKGKHIRNKVLEELLAWLWIGKVDRAIDYLRSLDPGDVKDTDQIEKLIAYFSRNLSFIPCYALRQRLGLRVSSNPVEKANDLLVSNRQKHQGMSWSADGSSSLATLTCLRRNGEHMQWLRRRDIRFSFTQPEQTQPAA